MLGNVQSNIGASRAPRVQWGQAEWDKITAQLHAKHPERRYKQYNSPPFTLDDVEEAAEATLPQESQRLIEDFGEIRAYLFEACGRYYGNKNMPIVTAQVIPGFNQDKINWRPEEWETVARELYAHYPEEVENNFQTLSLPQIRVAMAALPLERQRRFKQLVGLRVQLHKLWLDEGARIKASIAESRAVIEFPRAIIVQPVPKKSDEQNAVASAFQEAFSAPPKEAKSIKPGAMKYAIPEEPKRSKRIDWTDAEWMAIAREMLRQDPYGTLLTAQVPHISVGALRDAQREAVEPHRRRKLIHANGAGRQLAPKFKAIREENEAQKANEKADYVSEVTVQETYHALAYVEKPLQEEAPKAPLVEVAEPAVFERPIAAAPMVQEVVAAVSTEVSTTLASAAAPLVNFLLSKLATAMIPELTKALIPEIGKSLMPEIASALGQIQQPQAPKLPDFAAMMREMKDEIKSEIAGQVANIKIPAPVIDYSNFMPKHETPIGSDVITVEASPSILQPVVHKPVESSTPVFVQQPQKEKPRLPKVVLLGPMGAQEGEMVKYYKDKVEVQFIEHGKGIKEAGATCDLFCVSTRVPGTITKQVKAATHTDKIRYINGGLSSFKRDIDMWLMSRKA